MSLGGSEKFTSVYPGTVTDNKDPDGLGRVRALCPHVDDQTPIDFAWPCGWPLAGKAQRGGFFPPELGSTVVVMFVEGDRRFPIYFPGFFGEPDGNTEVPTLAQGQEGKDPLKRGFETGRWELLLDDNSPGKLQIKDKSGDGRLIFEDDGTVVLEGTLIEVGSGATQAALLGDLFKVTHDSHTHPTGVGPSGTPVTPMPASNLSTTVMIIACVWVPILALLYLILTG